jgi:hypothetical protein
VSGRSCAEIVRELTPYLDGELDGDRGSEVRGHLRLCAACREVATAEAALRDGLRALPPVDPPPALWGAIQAQLAAAEVADAQRPAWRRAAARWGRPAAQAGGVAVLAAAAALALWWRSGHRAATPDVSPRVVATGPAAAAPPTSPAPATSNEPDVAAELAAAPAARVASYQAAAAELDAVVAAARPRWPAARQARFDAERTRRFAAVSDATGRARERAWREAVRFLQDAAIDDGALAALDPTPSRGGPR